VRIDRLHLADFRSHRDVDISFAPGLTAILGDNGRGKTNLLEAIAFASRLGSFRGAPSDALVRVGADRAIVRAELNGDDRHALFEAEIPRTGRQRMQLNRQRMTRRAELLATYQVTVFAPDDLDLVKGGPSMRRELLDELVVGRRPRHDATRAEVDKVLRQRNALLKQLGGRLSDDDVTTLDVWDSRLAQAGDELGRLRDDVVRALEPLVTATYRELAGADVAVELRYAAPWRDVGLETALAAARRDDVRRGVTTVGPHRDELEVDLDSMPSRTHASQGEQRTLALALRLAGHRLITEAQGSAPTLLLDDVFSELDASRSAALLASLPAGQTVLTSAVGLPKGAHAEHVFLIGDDGAVAAGNTG
jgi:DNA replication and repair protein RecF